MKVLVIPEDPTHNGYILKPLVERLFEAVGKPNARVSVLTNPKVQGLATVRAELPRIYQLYKHIDVLMFMPDDDCQNRSATLKQIEEEAAEAGAQLIGCAAVSEVEAWLLAGHADKLSARWADVRADCDLKERFFEPFLSQFGDSSVGQGRKRLMREALVHFNAILARCPELVELKTRLEEVLS